ncbi:MAG: translation initiation factor [Bacteroidales bacterium]|nr:translation initiation factor [Candidatus Cryptobacteroides aphodequi]
MADNDWKKRLGVVFSTNPDFQYVSEDDGTQEETPAPSAQKLIVRIDRSGRAGKQVTLVEGFRGREEDLAELGRTLKMKCGVGGTAKDGQITIQGDKRDLVTNILNSMGYKARRGN